MYNISNFFLFYSLDWDRVTNSFIALTQLVPPTAKGKKSATREKAKNIIKKLIIHIQVRIWIILYIILYITSTKEDSLLCYSIYFSQSGTPLHTNENKGQPKLIAVGPNKLAIDQYFLKIDKHLILLETKDVIKAFDYLFKAHYAFHIEYDEDLKNFWTLIQHYFYKISSKCTNKVIETFIKIENTQKQSTHVDDNV